MIKTPKPPKTFGCEICNFKCFNKQDYTRHLSTVKHFNLTNPNYKASTPNMHSCVCGKTYKHSSTLCSHKNTCSFLAKSPSINEEIADPTNKDVMIEKLLGELTAERAEKNEMKSMFIMMMEKIQEMQQQNQEMQMKIQFCYTMGTFPQIP